MSSCPARSGTNWSQEATRRTAPMTQSLRKSGGVARMLASRIFEETLDARLATALGYLFERVAANEDGGVQPTYDLSVPDNVTYVANGMVSHNTIGLMMDCDTTGIEPDLALVKFKKLVGGGSMQIVNQTVPAGAEEPRLPGRAGRGDHRVHRRARPCGQRPRPAAGALRGLRLRDGRAVDQPDRPRPDDGRGPAVSCPVRSRRP